MFYALLYNCYCKMTKPVYFINKNGLDQEYYRTFYRLEKMRQEDHEFEDIV